jgi:ubiquinone/menaquinone biosynthesis C-methylase UbiE
VSFLTPTRVVEEELLDEENAPAVDVDRSLRDLRRINRYLGGNSIYQRMIRRLSPSPRPRTILDLGTGTSDQLDSLPDDLVSIRIGLDFKIEHLLFGRRVNKHRIAGIVGDASRLPFRSGSVDIVTSAHFFHHFEAEENVVILSEASRVARLGVAINDTRRHLVPLTLVRTLSMLRLVGRITRFDAPASVRRGYTIEEARRVGRRVAAARSATIRLFPFRFGLLLWK